MQAKFSRSQSPEPRVDAFLHSMKVEGQLRPKDIATLMDIFESSGDDGLAMEEFCTALRSVLPSGVTQSQLALLFMKIDTSCDGHVDWDEFCSYLMLEFECPAGRRLLNRVASGRSNSSNPLRHKAPIVRIFSSSRREASDPGSVGLSQLYSLDRDGVVGEWSAVGVWRRAVSLCLPPTKPWVVDGLMVPSIGKLIVVFLNGHIRFYDLASPVFELQYALEGLDTATVVFDFAKDRGDGSHAILYLGDTAGQVSVLDFPVGGAGGATLFHTETRKGNHATLQVKDLLARPTVPRTSLLVHRVHDSWVHMVQAGAAVGSFMSCSASESASLAIVGADKRVTVFCVPKGIYSFAHDATLNLILTGGADGFVRVWCPHVSAAANAVLGSHSTPIRALQVLVPPADAASGGTAECKGLAPDDARAVSLSEDHIVKVWNLRFNSCQHIVLPDPRPGQKPFTAVLLLHKTLVVAAQRLTCVPLMTACAVRRDRPESHHSALCAAAYNPLFQQVVTASRKNDVCVWNVLTGEKMLRFSNLHRNADLSTLAFDASMHRLLTGASDGSVKVWNFNVGLPLLKLLGERSGDVTAIVAVEKGGMIVTAGWSKRVCEYRESDEYYVMPDSVACGGLDEDIVSLVQCGPDFVVSSTYDGIVIAWKIGPLDEYFRFHTKHLVPGCVDHQVEKVLFLESRKHDVYHLPSLLTVGAGGWVRLWNFCTGHLAAEFQGAVDSLSVTVAAINVGTDSVIILGDSAGWIHVWDLGAVLSCATTRPAPALLGRWFAHDAVIVSLQHVPLTRGSPVHDARDFVLSASADKCARLWVLQSGQLVGTFGHIAAWDVWDPSSYNPKLRAQRVHHAQQLQICTTESDESGDGNGDENVDTNTDQVAEAGADSQPMPMSTSTTTTTTGVVYVAGRYRKKVTLPPRASNVHGNSVGLFDAIRPPLCVANPDATML